MSVFDETTKVLEEVRDLLEKKDLNEGMDPQDYAAKLIDKHKGLDKMLADKLKKLDSSFIGAKKRLDGHRKSGVGETEAVYLLGETYKVFKEMRKLMDMVEKEYKKAGVK